MNICMEIIASQKDKFLTLDKANGKILSFEKECLFAAQQITKSEFTFKTAEKNQGSLKNAIRNVASIGITLNPALHLAYLVPRDKQIILDISYRGLIKLATDTGSIKWAKADLVYKNDEFKYKGPCEKPEHNAEVFGDRGEMVGGYCIAKTNDDDYLIEIMNAEQINKVRKVSKCANGPWKTWPEEMAKKTIIKRAYKTWPQSQKKEHTERLGAAVDMLNENEGSAFTLEEQYKFMEKLKFDDPIPLFLFVKDMDDNKLNALYNSFADGEKVTQKKRYREQIAIANKSIRDWSNDYIDCMQAEDEQGAKDILDCDPALAQLILDATVKDQ